MSSVKLAPRICTYGDLSSPIEPVPKTDPEFGLISFITSPFLMYSKESKETVGDAEPKRVVTSIFARKIKSL